MYSPRLYKYRDCYVLYKPTVHTFVSVSFTHTLLVQTHTHNVQRFRPLVPNLKFYPLKKMFKSRNLCLLVKQFSTYDFIPLQFSPLIYLYLYLDLKQPLASQKMNVIIFLLLASKHS